METENTTTTKTSLSNKEKTAYKNKIKRLIQQGDKKYIEFIKFSAKIRIVEKEIEGKIGISATDDLVCEIFRELPRPKYYEIYDEEVERLMKEKKGKK